MKKKIKIFAIALFIFSNINSWGKNDSLKINELDFKVKKLEAYQDINDQKFENKSKELDLKLEDYKQQKNILDYIALIFGGLTLVGLWGFWQKVKDMADKKIEEKFEVILHEKKQQLVTIIDNHDKERKLKNDNSIFVIASKNSKTDFLETFFKKLGFTKIEIIKVSSYEKIEEQQKYDILFLFREEGNDPLSDEISNSYIEALRTDAIVFIFGNPISLSKVKARSSSATFWSQLHGNLISALKYQELLD